MANTFSVYYPPGGSSANPSVGTNGSTAPTSSTEVGYVNGSGNLTPVSSTTPLPVTNQNQDTLPATQNVTVVDTASTTVTYTNGGTSQTWISGTPTTGSAAVFAVNSIETGLIEIAGTWTGTLAIEVSVDNVNWIAHAIHPIGSALFASSFTQNVAGSLNLASKLAVRVRATAAMTGTAVIRLNESLNASTVYVANSIHLGDATTNTSATIKAASTAAAATDTALVVAISPNNTPVLPSGASTAALQSNVQSAVGTSATTAITVQGSSSGAALPISASALPLPTGAATAANQTTQVTALQAIQANQTNGTQVTTISGTVPLPTGAATAALQTTGNTSLATIATNTTGVATAANQTSIQGSVTGGTAATNSELVGGVYNSTLPTLTSGQQAAVQVDSNGRVLVSQPTAAALNVTDATGVNIQGSAAGGTAANNSALIGGVYNTTLPTLTNAQQSGVQLDSNGRVSLGTSAATIGSVLLGSSIPTGASVIGYTGSQIPLLVADNGSSVITTTTTSSTFTPTGGTAFQVNIPVTAVSGTNPTLSIAVQESSDNGTNWYTVYTFPTITATGSYNSPVLTLTGNRVRYVQTVTGTSPSFTRGINRLQFTQTNVINPNGTIFTDNSGSTSATPNTSTQIAAYNQTRRYLFIQNLSNSATIYINFTSAATTGSGSIAILPYGSYVMEASTVTNEAVNVISATASVPYTFKQG